MPKNCETLNIKYYNAYDYDYNRYAYSYEVLKTRAKHSYISVFGTFDIESSTIYESDDSGKTTYCEGFMYLWQVCFNGDIILGRTWEEFIEFIAGLVMTFDITINKRLVIYVHFLEFEFQFMRMFFEWDSVFALEKRKVIKALTESGIEFRCSYKLTNMSLLKFTENMKVKHIKMNGDEFNYKLLRHDKTPLKDKEIAYGITDVLGLWEGINVMMEKDGDTIASIPSTSTGYVRRDIKKAMEQNSENRDMFKFLEMDKEQYEMCREEFRGGNTHANRFFSARDIEDVYSVDIASSYIFVIACDYCPVSPWKEIEPYTFKKYLKEKCVLFRIAFYNISLRENVAMPYIPTAKCGKILNAQYDNGRIISADFIEITLTEIDYDIIKKQYDCELEICTKAFIADRGHFSRELRETMLNVYFYEKCTLKGVSEYNYMKSKNKLNAIFGMMVMQIVRNDIIYFDDEWLELECDIEESLKKFYKSRRNFLSYQQGIYITAHARNNLQTLLDIIGMDALYVDTDSIKFIDYEKYLPSIERLNDIIKKRCENADIPAYIEYNNERYYLGIWEKDDFVPYDRFKTFGAKKYAYEKDGQLHITISGMSKKKGVIAMDNNLDNFKMYRTYEDIGRTVSYYNDSSVHDITITDMYGKESTFTTGSNIGVLDTTYTLGITDEYFELLYK